jgi:acyl carrier protein
VNAAAAARWDPNGTSETVDLRLSAIADLLVELWKQILRTEDVRLDDGFFDLGGNSITAVRLLPLIEQRFRVEPHISVVFDHPTPRRLAAALAAIGAMDPRDAPR